MKMLHITERGPHAYATAKTFFENHKILEIKCRTIGSIGSYGERGIVFYSYCAEHALFIKEGRAINMFDCYFRITYKYNDLVEKR